MSQNQSVLGRMLIGAFAKNGLVPPAAQIAQQLPKPPGMAIAQMLGGNLFAKQTGDNSMSPLAMLQQFRSTGQMPQSPGSNVMFGQMPMPSAPPQPGGQMMSEMQVNPKASAQNGLK